MARLNSKGSFAFTGTWVRLLNLVELRRLLRETCENAFPEFVIALVTADGRMANSSGETRGIPVP
jgi:hypothetical protein